MDLSIQCSTPAAGQCGWGIQPDLISYSTEMKAGSGQAPWHWATSLMEKAAKSQAGKLVVASRFERVSLWCIWCWLCLCIFSAVLCSSAVPRSRPRGLDHCGQLLHPMWWPLAFRPNIAVLLCCGCPPPRCGPTGRRPVGHNQVGRSVGVAPSCEIVAGWEKCHWTARRFVGNPINLLVYLEAILPVSSCFHGVRAIHHAKPRVGMIWFTIAALALPVGCMSCGFQGTL